MIVQVQIRLQCLDERRTDGESRHALDLEIEHTIDEYPRDSAIWLAAFQSQYDGIGTFEKEQWGQSSSNYSVSLRISYKEPLDLLAPMRRSTYDLPAIGSNPKLMNTYPDANIILANRSVD